MSKPKRNIVLTGFMGSGKSTIGSILAKKLNRTLIDTDAVIERRFNKSISSIFAELGEAAFRDAEATLCRELAQQNNLVIATGGGTLVPRINFEVLHSTSSIFCLTARPKMVKERLKNSKHRPLFDIHTMHRLLEDRRSAYARIFHQIATDKSPPLEIAELILDLYELDNTFADTHTLMVKTPPEGMYPIYIKKQGLDQIGELLKWTQIPSRRVFIVANATVAGLYNTKVMSSLQASGFQALLLTIPDGENYKTLDTVADLYQQLLENKASRQDSIIALGGGVTGDIVGFVAATYLRGISFIQIPTTLLAMVDSSVGGKTGVDLNYGKNLVGAFKQPALVLIDPDVLSTLPKEEFRAGLAEVVKHGIISDVKLFEMLEQAPLLSSQDARIEDVLRRAVSVKIAIVEEDPLEQDRRAVLNLGHTFAHAIELVNNYRIRHGEAVSLGLIAAATLAHLLGLCDKSLPDRIAKVLKELHLPTSFSGLSPEAIVAAMAHDKKRHGDTLRFVLPRAIGEVDLVDVFAQEKVLAATKHVIL